MSFFCSLSHTFSLEKQMFDLSHVKGKIELQLQSARFAMFVTVY